MALNTIQEIEQVIGRLSPQQLAELYAWMDRRRPPSMAAGCSDPATVFEQGLGLVGSPEDAALLDEVVHIAYEERRRLSDPSSAL